MSKAIEAAQWFIENNKAFEEVKDYSDAHKKLHKLLYYAQAMNIAATGRELFSDKIEAWKDGPVVRKVYRHYRYNFLRELTKIIGAEYTLSSEQVQLLKIINYVYGGMSADELVHQTHIEKPWSDLKALVEERKNPEITAGAIKENYNHLADIYNMYIDYDFDSEEYICFGNVKFAYNKNETALNEEDIKTLEKISCMANEGDSLFVYKEDGELVVY